MDVAWCKAGKEKAGVISCRKNTYTYQMFAVHAQVYSSKRHGRGHYDACVHVGIHTHQHFFSSVP